VTKPPTDITKEPREGLWGGIKSTARDVSGSRKMDRGFGASATWKYSADIVLRKFPSFALTDRDGSIAEMEDPHRKRHSHLFWHSLATAL
jgi:hypothetical protein